MFQNSPKFYYFLLAAIFSGLLILIGAAMNFGLNAAPELTFTTITGKQMRLSALQGKPVLVTFWATDCLPCLREIPHLIELYRRHHEKGLEMIAVAMMYDPPSRVVSMAQSRQLPYEVVLDLDAGHAKAFGDVRLTPTTFLIGPDGKIIEHVTGAFDPAKMTALIEQLLNRKG